MEEVKKTEVVLQEENREEATKVMEFLSSLDRKQEKDFQMLLEGARIGMRLAGARMV